MKIEYLDHRKIKAVRCFTPAGSIPENKTLFSVHRLEPVKSDFNILQQYYKYDFYEVFYDSTGQGYPDNVGYYAVKKAATV